MHPSTLRHDIHLYTYLRQKLVEEFPDADDETIRDTLEGITTLKELLAETIRSALLDEALLSGLRSRLLDMKHRLVAAGGPGFEEAGVRARSHE